MEFESAFPLNLRRISIVRIAALLLDHPLLESKIRSHSLRQMNFNGESARFAINVESAIDQVLELCGYSLPLTLSSELTAAIKSMALKMHHWYIYIESQYEGNEKKTLSCIKKIFWSHYGSIDYRKTFEFCWLGNIELTKSDVFHMACNYAFEDHIRTHWEPISTTFPAFSNACLSMYWQSDFEGNLEAREIELNSTAGLDAYSCFPLLSETWRNGLGTDRIPIRVFMLVLATYQGHVEAVKYFWYTLDERLKRIHIVPWVHRLLYEKCYWHSELYAEICWFLWEQITYTNYVILHNAFVEPETLGDQCEILRYLWFHMIIGNSLSYFSSLWPWQDKFKTILEKASTFPELWEHHKLVPLVSVLKQILCSCDNFVFKISPARRLALMCITWRTIPQTMKLRCSKAYVDFFSYLLERNDAQIIKLIVNDEMMNSMKSELIEQCAQELLPRAKGTFQLMDKFLNIISSSDEEKKSIKQQLFICDYSVKNITVQRMDNFFKWQYKTDEEYSLFRTKLNVMDYWRRIMQKQMSSYANTFLEWYFDSVEEHISEFKKSLLSTTHPCDIIINFWCPGDLFTSTIDSARMSKYFLYWLLENDEAVATFIRNTLVNHSIKLPETADYFQCTRSDFLKWCSLEVTSAYDYQSGTSDQSVDYEYSESTDADPVYDIDDIFDDI